MKLVIVAALLFAVSSSQAQVATGPDGLVFRNLLSFTPSSLGHGGNIRPAFSGSGSNWDAIKGAGVGAVVLQLEPNATHLPHWHRGVELLFVINGNLTVGITSFNASVGFVEYNITNGDLIAVENAASHYVKNRGPGRSINLSAFSSDNPGTQVNTATLFNYPDTIVQTALQVPADQLGALRAAAAPTPALYDGLNGTAQKQTQTGNFTQALGSLVVPVGQTALPTAG